METKGSHELHIQEKYTFELKYSTLISGSQSHQLLNERKKQVIKSRTRQGQSEVLDVTHTLSPLTCIQRPTQVLHCMRPTPDIKRTPLAFQIAPK